MKYKIKITRPAEKFIIKLSKSEQARVLRAIYRLPCEGDIRPLRGHRGIFRLRVGDYRILYTVDNGKLIVFIIDAGSRGDIYKRY